MSVSTPRRRGAWGLPGCLSGIAGMCDLTTPGPERSLGDSTHIPQHDAVETASLGASKLMGFVRIATHSVVSSHSSCALCWSHPRGGLGCTPPPLPSTPPIPRASHAGSASLDVQRRLGCSVSPSLSQPSTLRPRSSPLVLAHQRSCPPLLPFQRAALHATCKRTTTPPTDPIRTAVGGARPGARATAPSTAPHLQPKVVSATCTFPWLHCMYL